MGELRVRISDELHHRVRTIAGGKSVNAFAREAIAEKVGRELLEARVARLEQRVRVLERRLRQG